MNTNIDGMLKTHFSTRADVPQHVREALYEKLHATSVRETLPLIWLIAPCMLLTAIVVLVLVSSIFGFVPAIILGAGFYSVATIGGFSILAAAVITNRKKLEKEILL